MTGLKSAGVWLLSNNPGPDNLLSSLLRGEEECRGRSHSVGRRVMG